MTEKPKISIIIPTYNRAHTIASAVASVREQRYENIEIIVVDDCSSDTTQSVITALADTRITYLRRATNGGVAAARNDGLRAATGDYLAFLDSDDTWLPHKLEAQLQAFADYGTVGLVFVNAYEVADGTTRLFIDKTMPSRVIYGSKERAAGIFPGSIMTAPPTSWMIKRSVAAETGFFDETMRVWEDCDYLARLARRFDLYFLNTPLAVRMLDGTDHLTRNMPAWHAGKNIFYTKHARYMKNDRKHLFRFYKGMAKDCLILKDRANALRWLAKALGINPFALSLYGKALKAALLPL